MLFLFVDVCLTGFILQNKERRDRSPKRREIRPAACLELWPARAGLLPRFASPALGGGRGCLPDPFAVFGKRSVLTIPDAGDERVNNASAAPGSRRWAVWEGPCAY